MWIAARKGCLIAETVYWYSMAPKDRADSSTVLAVTRQDLLCGGAFVDKTVLLL